MLLAITIIVVAIIPAIIVMVAPKKNYKWPMDEE